MKKTLEEKKKQVTFDQVRILVDYEPVTEIVVSIRKVGG